MSEQTQPPNEASESAAPEKAAPDGIQEQLQRIRDKSISTLLDNAKAAATEFAGSIMDSEFVNKHGPATAAMGMLMAVSQIYGASVSQAFIVTMGRPPTDAELDTTRDRLHQIVEANFNHGTGEFIKRTIRNATLQGE